MKHFLLLLIAISFGISNAQQNIDFKSSNFKDDKEGLKNALLSLENGDASFKKAQELFWDLKDASEEYSKALFHYKKAYAFNPNNAQLNFYLGVCYLNTSEKEKAPALIQSAYSMNPELAPDLWFYLGMVYQLQEKFDEAIKAYNTCKNGKVGEKYNAYITEYIKGCNNAKNEQKQKRRIWADNMQEFNSEFDDLAPAVSADGEFFMFSSNRPNQNPKNELDMYDFDMYETLLKQKKWSNVTPAKGNINSKNDELNGALSYDGQRILIQRKEGVSYDLFESKLKGENWSLPELKCEKMPDRTTYHEKFGCYEPLDIKTYFITNNGSSGGNDIFFTGKMVLKNIVDWGKPSSIGHNINTKLHEGSIYVYPNNKVIYFSSQGHGSLGGYDIYRAEFVNGQWTNPVNLGYPINTPYDELFYAPTADGKYAYISSNRPGGKGGYDIYKITYLGEPKQPLVDAEDLLLASQAEPIKNNFSFQKSEVNRQSLTIFKGQIIDQLTQKSVYANIEIIDNEKNEVINTLNSNEASGKFLISLPAGKNYGIAVQANGYLFHSENFIIPDESNFEMIEKVIELKNIAIGSKITLKNIFFDVAKSVIKPESNAELDRIYELLNEIPSLKIELAGHTDNTGNENSNVKLSQDRAEAVKNYLIQKGISSNRLQSKGYGSSKPIAKNDTEEGRQMNRRTEFEIIGN